MTQGVPRAGILRVSELLATKLVENEFAAYLDLQALMESSDALSPRGFTIASYALCGLANLGSLAIQIGVLSALVPSRTRLIARIGPSAMICGFISTLQAAGIARVNLTIRSAELLIEDACLPFLQWYARLILGLCRLGFWGFAVR
jgi:nucleoside permease NupC